VPFDLSMAVLVAVGLVLASAWVNLLLLGREKARWANLQHVWGTLDMPGADMGTQAHVLCHRLRTTLDAPYCSLWVKGPSSGLFRPIAHDGSPLEETSDSGPRRETESTIPGEVPSEIVSRAWSTGEFQEWGSAGQRWVVQPVSSRADGGGAIVVRLGRGRALDREVLQLAAVPAATLALRMGTDRELTRTRRELDDIRAEMIEESKLAAVGRLAAGVAHELNTPLGAVLTMVGSLTRTIQEKDVLRRLQIMRDGVEKCKAIIEKLLVFSRGPVESEEGLTFSRFVRAPMEMNRIVREAVDLLEEQLSEDGVKVVTELGNLPPIRANSTQWGQVLTNLIANARDAMKSAGTPDPTITVRTSAEGKHLLLTVSDNGPGIPQNLVGRIFDPFFTTKDIGKGTGLGLAIVREIVKKHDGNIDIQTQEGAGTTFVIKVPAGAAAQRLAAGSPV